MTTIETVISPQAGMFLVSMSSSDEDRPCDEAYEVKILQVARFSADHLLRTRFASWWHSKGTNHRVENGQICRDMGWEIHWAVKVNDVMDFVDKHGACVVGRNTEGFATIEIYDTWRE